MKHEAKVDWWIGASLVVGLLVSAKAAVTSHNPVLYGVALTVWIVVFGLCYPQSYETTTNGLVIRGGLRKWTIPYSEITAIRPSNDSRSALALSLDRVEIEYTSGDLLIAPKDQEAFFADLATRAPQLSRRGQDLVVSFS